MTKMRQIIWLGSSLKDLKAQPEPVQREMGYVLDHVQRGEHHQQIKPLKELGSVYEIKSDFNRDTFRTVYAINIGDYIYVLYVFLEEI